MTQPGPEAWKSSALAKTYIEGVRMGIPLAKEQIDVMLRLAAASDGAVSNFWILAAATASLRRRCWANTLMPAVFSWTFPPPCSRRRRVPCPITPKI